MIDFVRKHKAISILLVIFLILILVLIFAGHFIFSYAIEQFSDMRTQNKNVCTIKTDNATQINYNGITYQITNESVDKAKIGGWNGVCRKIAVLDDQFRVLKQEKSEIDYDSQIKALAKELPKGAKYIVTYYNIFSIKGEKESEAIAVNLGDGTFLAVPAGNLPAGKVPIKFDKDTCELVISAENKG